MSLRSIWCLVLLASLAGCAGQAVAPSPTSGQVMAAQYRARGQQRPISGGEADAIMASYRKTIAAPPASRADAMTDTTVEK